MKSSFLTPLRVLGASIVRHNNRVTCRKYTKPSQVGISKLRQIDKTPDHEDKSRFPTFETLNVSTQDRIHNFSVPSDRVIKFIKLGAVNKAIAVQYCHYLAELTRTVHDDDREYYAKRCIDLMAYIIRHYKDMPNYAMADLICDVSNTTRDNCRSVHTKYLDDQMISKFSHKYCTDILTPCYKFQMWDEAEMMINKSNNSLVNIHIIQPLVAATLEACKELGQLEKGSPVREHIADKIINHLLSVFDKCEQHRVQFVTKHRSEFIKALEDLGIKVQIGSHIKMTGRCTHCDTMIPLYDSSITKSINEAIRQQLLSGSDKGLYMNAAPDDSRRFETFFKYMMLDKRPVDCVIDGLNVAYKNSVGMKFVTKSLGQDLQVSHRLQSPENQARVLINIIIRGNFLKEFKKILVVGKHHMTKWPGLLDFFQKHNIYFYKSFNDSKDDLFMLFAATLNSRTILVTNDFLRDHLALMNQENRELLERWIDTHQAWISQKNLKPIWPTPYQKLPSTNREAGFFHVPIIDGNMVEQIGVSEPPPHVNNKMLTWICCRLPDNRSETQHSSGGSDGSQ